MKLPPLYSQGVECKGTQLGPSTGPQHRVTQATEGGGGWGLLSICQRLEVWLSSPEFPKVNPQSKRNVLEMHRSGCLLKEIHLWGA